MEEFEKAVRAAGFSDCAVTSHPTGMIVVRINTTNGHTYQKFSPADIEGCMSWLSCRESVV